MTERSALSQPDFSLSQSALVAWLAEPIVAICRPHPVRVAVDGPDAVGKTTLADALAVAVERCGRPVIRASIDGFHRTRAERYRQGAGSPRGYYEDSFDYDGLRAALLAPLAEDGSRRYRRAIFDFRTDQRRDVAVEVAPDDAVLILDGVFLLRPELVDAWDFSVFLTAGVEEILRRVRVRDAQLFGSSDAAERRYWTRYLPAQQLYLAEVQPDKIADVVVRNDDPRRPVVERARASRSLGR